jgi:hypothetical protein
MLCTTLDPCFFATFRPQFHQQLELTESHRRGPHALTWCGFMTDVVIATDSFNIQLCAEIRLAVNRRFCSPNYAPHLAGQLPFSKT